VNGGGERGRCATAGPCPPAHGLLPALGACVATAVCAAHPALLANPTPEHLTPLSKHADLTLTRPPPSLPLLPLQKESKFAHSYACGVHKSKYWEMMYEDSMDLIARLPQVLLGLKGDGVGGGVALKQWRHHLLGERFALFTTTAQPLRSSDCTWWGGGGGV